MSILIRIIIAFLIIVAGLFYFKPEIFHSDFFSKKEISKIDIQQYVLTPDPSALFLLSLKVSTLKDYSFNWIAQATDLYFEWINLFNVNIISLLDETNNKKLTLKTYLAQLQNTIDKIDNSIASLTSLYSQEESLANNYLTQKQVWDNLFTEWFVQRDTKTVIEWLKVSHDNWPKYMAHRIIANASNIVLSKLRHIRQLLYLKLTLLETNQDTIITNYNLIRWDLLPKLIELKRRLENNYYY